LAFDDFNEGHTVGGVEEVHSDELGGTARAGSDLGDRQRGRVGGKDGLGLADLVKLHEDVFLQLHLLDGGLNDEVGIALSRLACVRLFMTTGILAANAFTIPLAMVPVPITQIFMMFDFIC